MYAVRLVNYPLFRGKENRKSFQGSIEYKVIGYVGHGCMCMHAIMASLEIDDVGGQAGQVGSSCNQSMVRLG